MRIHLAVVSLLTALTLNAAPLLAQSNPDWHREIPGFKIAGNLYYVGTADLAVYLVNTPQGNILINSDFKEDVPAIKKAIAQLGFKYADIRIILISHAHGDHDEATGVIRRDRREADGDGGRRRGGAEHGAGPPWRARGPDAARRRGRLEQPDADSAPRHAAASTAVSPGPSRRCRRPRAR